MRVPVRPSPALQCTATAPPPLMVRSAMSMNSRVISRVGLVPSSKYTTRVRADGEEVSAALGDVVETRASDRTHSRYAPSHAP